MSSHHFLVSTEIISERTKTDTWINGQINLNAPVINDLLELIARLKGLGYVEVILKPESQAPQIEVMKANGDQLAAGHMTPELFVKNSYKNLTLAEQEREINYIKARMSYELGLEEMAQEQEEDVQEDEQTENSQEDKEENTDKNPKGE